MKTSIAPLLLRVRLYRPDGNLLRRPSDRLESAFVLVALLLTIASVWPAVLGGRLAYENALRDERAVGRHQVMATLSQDAPAIRVSFTEVPVGNPTTAVRWTTPAGELRSGQVPVPPPAKAGAVVPIWIDSAGAPTSPPTDGTTLYLRGVATGILIVLGAALPALASYAVFRWLLDRRRYREWDIDWVLADQRWRRPRR